MFATFTPIEPKHRGRVVHATSLTHKPGRTECGKRASGWKVSLRLVDCLDCKKALHLDARGKR